MKLSEKTILSIMYVCQIDGKSAFEQIKKKSLLSPDAINSKIDELIKNQLVNEDRTTLTEIGRNSLHVVLSGGVFDIIHPGHIYTLNAAKALGDVLVVVVATDNTSEKNTVYGMAAKIKTEQKSPRPIKNFSGSRLA